MSPVADARAGRAGSTGGGAVMFEHADKLIDLAIVLLGLFGYHKASERIAASIDWVRRGARRAFDTAVQLADPSKLTNARLTELAMSELKTLAKAAGKTLSEAHWDLAQELVEELVGAFATERIKHQLAVAAAMTAQIAAKAGELR